MVPAGVKVLMKKLLGPIVALPLHFLRRVDTGEVDEKHLAIFNEVVVFVVRPVLALPTRQRLERVQSCTTQLFLFVIFRLVCLSVVFRQHPDEPALLCDIADKLRRDAHSVTSSVHHHLVFQASLDAQGCRPDFPVQFVVSEILA